MIEPDWEWKAVDRVAKLTGEISDRTGPRQGGELRRGNPHQVAAMAGALAFEHKSYCDPTPRLIARTLRRHARGLWAGEAGEWR